MTERTPGLLVARHVLWRIALTCTVASLAVIATTSLIPGVSIANGYRFVYVLVGIILYAGIACWIAYGVVRMIGTYRYKTSE